MKKSDKKKKYDNFKKEQENKINDLKEEKKKVENEINKLEKEIEKYDERNLEKHKSMMNTINKVLVSQYQKEFQ